MRFTAAVIIAAVPSLIVATPRPTTNFIKVPLSKRSNLVDKDGVVDMALLNAHVANTIAKIHRGFENYKNNTGTVHPSAKNLQQRDPGSVALTHVVMNSNELWQGAIAVGTPPVTYTGIFDTGSADAILPGANCGTSCFGHTAYSPADSWSSNWLSRSFSALYGDGASAIGELYTDTVQIAGLNATGQTIGAASYYSTELSSFKFRPDGIIGMAFWQISAYGAKSVPETLVDRGQIGSESSVFAFILARSGSELHIGGTDPSRYIGHFFYILLTKRAHWQIAIAGVVVQGNFIPMFTESIIDTGTPLIYGDLSNVEKLYQAVDGSVHAGGGFYLFPCDNIPRVSLVFGDRAFPISRSTFSLGQASPGSAFCIGGIVGQSGLNTWIIGDVFLANVYTVFDIGKSRVGFATLA